MKAIFPRLTMAMLVLVLAFSLTACMDGKKIEEYNAGIVAATAVINEGTTEFDKAVDAVSKEYSDENRQAVLDAIKKREEGFNQLGNLEAPERYAEVQASFKEAAELFSQAAAIYTEQFSSVTSADKFNDEFVAKLVEGDQLMAQAQEKLQEGASRGNEIESGR